MPKENTEQPKLNLFASGVVEDLIAQGREPYVTRIRTYTAEQGEQLHPVAIVPSVCIGPDDRVEWGGLGTHHEVYSADGARIGQTESYWLTDEQATQIRERIKAAKQNS